MKREERKERRGEERRGTYSLEELLVLAVINYPFYGPSIGPIAYPFSDLLLKPYSFVPVES